MSSLFFPLKKKHQRQRMKLLHTQLVELIVIGYWIIGPACVIVLYLISYKECRELADEPVK